MPERFMQEDRGLSAATSSRITYFSVYEGLRMLLMVMVGFRYVYIACNMLTCIQYCLDSVTPRA